MQLVRYVPKDSVKYIRKNKLSMHEELSHGRGASRDSTTRKEPRQSLPQASPQVDQAIVAY